MGDSPRPDRRPDPPRGAHRRRSIAGLGVELAGAVIGFTLLGLWIDHHYDTAPWGTLVCVAMGLIGGFYNFIRESRAALDDATRRGDPS